MQILVLLMKKYTHLSQGQRYQLEALLKIGMTKTYISKFLGVHRSTLYREINRNSKQQYCRDKYEADFAHQLSEKRLQLKPRYQKQCKPIERRIIWLLRHKWSPEQISNVCKQRNISMLSTEAIYLWVYSQKRKGKDYTHLLRRHHRKRRKRKLDKQPRTLIKNKVPIIQRPPIVDQQSRIGDLEADLVKCKHEYLLNITDRKSLFNIFCKIPDKASRTVEAAMVEELSPHKDWIKTITTDNGLEFARHEAIASALDVDWYFADPYSSWQRGCNENQNGLIRQYASRKRDLRDVSSGIIKQWQKQLNSRPRKKLNFKPPNQLINPQPCVALTS
jgi:IS30 family transposase